MSARHFKEFGKWTLLPRPKVTKPPEQIPEHLSDAYYQASVLIDISPKASCALARYCLHGIIRDFWSIPAKNKNFISTDINKISKHISPETMESIGLIRAFGDIDSYLDKDVDFMVDGSSEETRLIIALLEVLFDDWYVERHKRTQRKKAIKLMVETLEKDNVKQLTKVASPPAKSQAQILDSSHDKPKKLHKGVLVEIGK